MKVGDLVKPYRPATGQVDKKHGSNGAAQTSLFSDEKHKPTSVYDALATEAAEETVEAADPAATEPANRSSGFSRR